MHVSYSLRAIIQVRQIIHHSCDIKHLSRNIRLEAVILGLVGQLALLGASIPASTVLVLLKLHLRQPAGVVLATRLRGQRSLETVLGLGLVPATLGDVLAVGAVLVRDVLAGNVGGCGAGRGGLGDVLRRSGLSVTGGLGGGVVLHGGAETGVSAGGLLVLGAGGVLGKGAALAVRLGGEGFRVDVARGLTVDRGVVAKVDLFEHEQ